MSHMLPPKTRHKKLNIQRGRCFYCGVDLIGWGLDIEEDHILPFSKYKNGTVNNMCLCCKECNRKKSDKELDEFKKILRKEDKLFRGQFYFEFLRIDGSGDQELFEEK